MAQEKFINSSRIEENEISQSTGSITGDGNQDIYQEINFSKSTKIIYYDQSTSKLMQFLQYTNPSEAKHDLTSNAPGRDGGKI